MSAAFISSLLEDNQQIIIFVGIPIFFVGLFGGIFNIIVFLSLKTFRQSSCAFYLTILSVVNIFQLISTLLIRIMIKGFQIDFTERSSFYCKLRTFAFQVTTMISFTCICLATMDQYFATCSRVQWQRWSHIKIAHRLVIFAALIVILEQSPFLFFYGHVRVATKNRVICIAVSESFIKFNTYVNQIILANILPYLITFSFGIMAYRNVQEIAYRSVPLVRRELDKQLTVMVPKQVIYAFVSLFPSTIVYVIIAYGNVQDLATLAHLRVIYALMTCFYYSYFASPFYIYVYASERFRRQLVHVLRKFYLKRCQRHIAAIE